MKSLNTEVVDLILKDRRRNGPFKDLPDLLRRVPLPLEQARILVRVGALRFTGRNKPQLLWDLALMHGGVKDASPIGDLFVAKVPDPKLPHLDHYPLADAYDELDLLGFPLCDPFTLVDMGMQEGVIQGRRTSVIDADDTSWMAKATHRVVQMPVREGSISNEQVILQREMHTHVGKRVTMFGYMIHVKSTDTHYGERMTFGSFIDTAGDFWDSTQFPRVAERFPFRGRGVYRLVGHVEEEFGHCSLRTQYMEKLPWSPDPRYGAA